MREDVIEYQLLDLEVDHHVPVELALQEPPQRLNTADIVPDLRLAPSGSAAPRRHGPEEQPRLLPAERPARPGLEGAVIDHYRDRGGMQTLGSDLVDRVGGRLAVPECEYLADWFCFGRHFECVSL